MTKIEIGSYLIVDPEVCHGQITFRGTRIPVDTVLTYLAKGYSVDQLLRSWPELTKAAIEEVLEDTLSRTRRRRLTVECAKLNVQEEKMMVEEGMSKDLITL